MNTRQLLNEKTSEALTNLAKHSLYFKSNSSVRTSGKSTLKSQNTLADGLKSPQNDDFRFHTERVMRGVEAGVA